MSNIENSVKEEDDAAYIENLLMAAEINLFSAIDAKIFFENIQRLTHELLRKNNIIHLSNNPISNVIKDDSMVVATYKYLLGNANVKSILVSDQKSISISLLNTTSGKWRVEVINFTQFRFSASDLLIDYFKISVICKKIDLAIKEILEGVKITNNLQQQPNNQDVQIHTSLDQGLTNHQDSQQEIDRYIQHILDEMKKLNC